MYDAGMNRQRGFLYRRSLREQPCDLQKCFPMMKKLGKIFTVKDLPPEMVPLRDLCRDAMEELSSSIKLKPSKMRALEDFIACLLEIPTQACTSRNIEHKCRYPVMTKILATCMKTILTEDMDLIDKHFEDYYSSVREVGGVKEEMFHVHGFRLDTDTRVLGRTHIGDYRRKTIIHLQT